MYKWYKNAVLFASFGYFTVTVALSWIKDNYTSLGLGAVIVLMAGVLASVLALILNLALDMVLGIAYVP